VGHLFFVGQGINSVFPANIHIPTEGENTVVGLGKVQTAIGSVVGSQKGKFAEVTEANSYSDVLRLGSRGVEGSVVQRKIILKHIITKEETKLFVNGNLCGVCLFFVPPFRRYSIDSLTPSRGEMASNPNYPCTS